MAAVAYDTTLSELDSLSDSDWLDIASSRGGETDDDGALSEPGSEPGSLASGDDDAASANGADGIDHWEGLNDEGPSRSPSSSSLPTPLAARPPNAGAALLYRHNAPRGALSPLARNVLATEEDLAEDERVQSALDQSMVSTLSTSSSQSRGSPELRLSFPDPLTSSRDTLMNSSYEDVHESVSADDADTEPDSGVTDNDGTLTYIPSGPSGDAGVSSMPVFHKHETSANKNASEPSVGKLIRDHMRSPHIPVILVALSMALGYVMWGAVPTTPPVASVADMTRHRAPNMTSLKSVEANASALALIPATKADIVAIGISSTSAISVVPKAQNGLSLASSTNTQVVVARQECAGALTLRVKPEDSSPPVASTSAMQLPPSTPNGLSVVPTSSSSSISVYTTTSFASPPKLDVKGKGKAIAHDVEYSLGAWIGSTFEEFMRSFGLGEFYDVKREIVRSVNSLGDAISRAAARTESNVRNALTWVQGVLPERVREVPRIRQANFPNKEELKTRRTRAKARARVIRENVVEHVKVRARVAQDKARVVRENIQARRTELRVERQARKAQRSAERKDRQEKREQRRAQRKAKRL